MKKVEKRTWLDEIKKYFVENSHIFAAGLSIMSGRACDYTIYQKR